MIFTDMERNAIYRDYHGKVYGYILSKTGNRQDAEDLASDVFLKVYEKLDTFDETKASLSTWIYTVTKNTLTDYYRTRRIPEELPENEADGFSVEEEICNAEMLKILANALEALEERERNIIILRFYSGRTLKEISSQMGISYAYVRVLHNRALQNLRLFFEKQ